MNAFRSGFGFGYQHSFSRAQIFSQNIHNSQKFTTAAHLTAIFIVAFITGFSISRIFTPVKDTVAESPVNVATLETKAKITSVNPLEQFELATLITPDSAKISTKTTETGATENPDEPTDAPDPTEDTSETKKTEKKTTSAKKAKKAKKTTSVIQNNTFATGAKTIPVRTVATTATEAGDYLNLLSGYNFAYIHNYILGTLSDTFSITKNGKTTTYKVVKKVTYTCSKNGKTGCHGHNYLFKGSKTISMGAIANSDYDLAIMTCAGKSLGNGDATKRLVFYAQKL